MGDDRPAPAELIGAVIEFLATTARPALAGHARFESLIAIRLLQIAAADYERGPLVREHESDRLRELLGHGGDAGPLEAELVARIRDGDLDQRERGALLETLRAKRERLEIANPGYLRDA